MRGHAVGLAAMATAAVVLTRTERASTSVIAFAADALVLQGQSESRTPAALVDDLLSLRGKGRTDLALALRTAARELAREPAAERLAIVLSDCRATAGKDPLLALSGLDRVDVLGTAEEADAVEAGRRLAARARWTLPPGRPLQRASNQSSGASGLEDAWSHLDEWLLDGPSHHYVRSPDSGCDVASRGEARPTMLRSVITGPRRL